MCALMIEPAALAYWDNAQAPRTGQEFFTIYSSYQPLVVHVNIVSLHYSFTFHFLNGVF